MKVVVFSDIHGDLVALERLMAMDADYYFAAGDLTSWSRGLKRVGRVLERRAEQVYVLPGNHESAETIGVFCGRYGLNDFHGRVLEVDGVQIAGLGYSNPTPFRTPGEYTEPELASRLETFAGLSPLVLICHCPPLGSSLDRMGAETHAGSRAVRDFIDRHQPAAFFCGHIHEAHGASERIGRTKAWNAGKQGVLLDFATLEL